MEKQRNRLWRIPLASGALTTLVYAWLYGIRNVPSNNVILSCFSGKDGSIIPLPDQIILSFHISDLWNILLVSIVVFFLVWFFQESGKSKTKRRALGKLYDLGFLILVFVAGSHFLVSGVSDINYWGPLHGSNFIFLFSFIFSLTAFYLRRRIGFVNLVSSIVFVAFLISVPLSLISGIPTGVFALLVSLVASFSACFLYTLILWISGEKIFTSLDWLRDNDFLNQKNKDGEIEQRVRYYLAENGKYQQLVDEKSYLFSIFWGLKGCINGSKKTHSIDSVCNFIAEFQRLKNSRGSQCLSGMLSSAKFIYTHGDNKNSFSNFEEFAVFSGFWDPILNSEMSEMSIEDFLGSLAAYVAEKLEQERVVLVFDKKIKIIKRHGG